MVIRKYCNLIAYLTAAIVGKLTFEGVCISGSAAAIAIVSATPIGKWENPGGATKGSTGMDPTVAVVAPSMGEKSELPSGNIIDLAEPLVSSASNMLGSPVMDNKLRLTSSVESELPVVAIAKVR